MDDERRRANEFFAWLVGPIGDEKPCKVCGTNDGLHDVQKHAKRQLPASDLKDLRYDGGLLKMLKKAKMGAK